LNEDNQITELKIQSGVLQGTILQQKNATMNRFYQ